MAREAIEGAAADMERKSGAFKKSLMLLLGTEAMDDDIERAADEVEKEAEYRLVAEGDIPGRALSVAE